MRITASVLYNYIQCPHKVWRDKYGPQEEKDQEANAFLQLLWDRGVLHEEKVIVGLGDFVDLSDGTYDQRFDRTMAEMQKGTPLLYQGVLLYDNLLGIPDLLVLNGDGSYTPIDIKSGRGYEKTDDEEEEKYKKHYAVQLCHYLEILKKLGKTKSEEAKIIDIKNNQVTYDLTRQISPKNTKTWWQFYYDTRNEVEPLIENRTKNSPALGGACKQCQWYKSCKKWAQENHDLTTLYKVGRSKRDTLNEDLGLLRVEEVLDMDLAGVLKKKLKDKSFLRGIGESTLRKIVNRAYVLSNCKGPAIYKHFDFPKKSYELFFDIEDDPTQELVYLHGVYERSPKGERFLSFVAKETTAEAEKQAWLDFWGYIKTLPHDDYVVYYYAPHEKTFFNLLREQYPDVISEDELASFFEKDRAIDLFTHVINPHTDWPLSSYSVKELAQYLGFNWRDPNPSGALSIQWFNDYLVDKDPKKLQRILYYNEDDCKAMLVIKDYLVKKQSCLQPTRL